ncbi:hypothetical protein B0H13DRAFT_2123857 [Mycena leptocephala]|nr:hypothetical protein B0H13DRAFT_2161630 [Mycena leptocephala]KAJ7824555.1 hypothetical protein B0H13DRAFT_2123857 [Mycena leptocephala]
MLIHATMALLVLTAHEHIGSYYHVPLYALHTSLPTASTLRRICGRQRRVKSSLPPVHMLSLRHHQATSAIPLVMTFHHLMTLWRIHVADAARVGVVSRGMWRGSSYMHSTPYFKVSRISLKTLPLYPILFPQYTLDVAYSGWGKKYLPLHLPP